VSVFPKFFILNKRVLFLVDLVHGSPRAAGPSSTGH